MFVAKADVALAINVDFGQLHSAQHAVARLGFGAAGASFADRAFLVSGEGDVMTAVQAEARSIPVFASLSVQEIRTRELLRFLARAGGVR